MRKSKILFQLSGSIACFKACALLSMLVKDGHEVEVVATASALKFVGEATLEGLAGRRVHKATFEAGTYMSHIHLVRWADVILLCPASANTLNKMSSGIGDDLVTTLFLAHDFKKPYLVVPAMNQSMYAHPATQASLKTLGDWGLQVLATGSGALACGENGEGRMLEPEEIHTQLSLALTVRTLDLAFSAEAKIDTQVSECDARARQILITSGGTQEPIDGVRAITNTSTGVTGAKLASWFSRHGDAVTLLHAKGAVVPEEASSMQLAPFTSFKSLQSSVTDLLSTRHFDAVIHLAAVADFSVFEVEANGAVHAAPLASKIESSDELTLRLTKNPKLIDSIRALSKNADVQVVAFKLTHTNVKSDRRKAVENLAAHAKADFIVQNDISEITSVAHPFTIYSGEAQPIATAENADQLAEQLSRFFSEFTSRFSHFERGAQT